MKIYEMTLAQLIEARESKKVKPEEILAAYQARTEEVEEKVRSFLDRPRDLTAEYQNSQLNRNSHSSQNNQNDKSTKSSNSGQSNHSNQNNQPNKKTTLTGIPVALKANMATCRLTTSCGSRILENYRTPYQSTVANKITGSGGVIAGKTNMDEFAMGSTTEHSAFQVTRNPWNLNHVPGGSSGGSAAAVAAGEVPCALGSDTGGSIRQPAAFCGVVGLKPTYGVVSRYGLAAFASSLDQIGPLTRRVEDAAIMLNIISGADPLDSTSARIDYPDYTARLEQDISGMTFGLPASYLEMDIDGEIKDQVLQVAEKLKEAGAEVREITLPPADLALAAYYIIATAEASSNLARYDGVQYGVRQSGKNVLEMFVNTRSSSFGPEVKRRIMLGTFALSSGYQDELYKQALKVRTLIKEKYEKVFTEVDIILGPNSPTPAFKIGEDMDPLDVYYTDIFTVPVNISGFPALSLPSGFSTEGLPLSVQLIGPAFGEVELLQAASGLEKRLDVPTLAALEGGR